MGIQERKEREKERRRQQIMVAAKRVFSEKGFNKATMEDIAHQAELSPGTLYLYFQSKDELLQALLTQVGEAMALDLEAVLAAPDPPPDKLRRVVAMLLQYVEQERELFPVYLRELIKSKSSREAISPSLQKHEERNLGLLTRLFTEGMVSKQFINVNPRLLAYLLKGMARAVGYYQMTVRHQGAFQEALPVVLELLFSGIVLPPETPEEEAL